MSNKCVVRNETYKKSAFRIRERHNERKNQSYDNGDILPERSHLNIHFKDCPTTYEKEFNRMVKAEEISLRGLREDANVFDEMVFDVNSLYFEERGGYEYAKAFFREAYNMAVKEAGGEQYVLSAVLHADERNTSLSDKLGRDVFHYHLHVVYVPVVDKEVKWSKRCKDPEKVGKVKEVLKQVSHSKKWPRITTDEGYINSYSLLQDRFYEHMQKTGFTDFERGERGSTAKHLSVLDYKISKDTARLEALEQDIAQREKRLDALDKKMTIAHRANHTYGEIEDMGRKGATGKIVLNPEDWKQVLSLSKEGIAARAAVPDLKRQLESARKDGQIYKARWQALQEKTGNYIKAVAIAPDLGREMVEAALRQHQEMGTIRARQTEGRTDRKRQEECI